ncbi:MAG: ribosome maturation factor RimP [Actinomycetota bacterium]
MATEDRVLDLLSPVVATLGVELLDVEFSGGFLRVTVDEPRPEGFVPPSPAENRRDEGVERAGITTERLAEVNRLISPILDQHDPVSGRYTLEVSSPGLERPLRRPEHFGRAIGETVVIKLTPESEVRRVKGVLVGVEADGTEPPAITVEPIEIDGNAVAEGTEARTLVLAEISSARTVYEWGPSPKPGKGPRKPKPAKAVDHQADGPAPTTAANGAAAPTPEEEVRDEQ